MCQERIYALGQGHEKYVPSAILSKKIKEFHKEVPTLKPFLQESFSDVFHEVDAEQSFDVVFSAINAFIEPTIIHIRVGSNNELRADMVTELVTDGFTNLEVNDLIRNETERRTAVGNELLGMISAGKIIPANLIVRMLRKIIFSGQKNTKFILTNFPDIIEHVHEFEENCSKISAVFFTTKQGEVELELKNNNLTLFNIDSLF